MSHTPTATPEPSATLTLKTDGFGAFFPHLCPGLHCAVCAYVSAQMTRAKVETFRKEKYEALLEKQRRNRLLGRAKPARIVEPRDVCCQHPPRFINEGKTR